MEEKRNILGELLGYLGVTQSELAASIGMDRYRISDIKRSKRGVFPADVAVETVKVHPEINYDWLVGKSEKMLRDNAVNYDTYNPYYDSFTIQGGIGRGFGNEQALLPTGFMGVPGIRQSPDIPFVRVSGDSMLNIENPRKSIPEGSWIALVPEQTGKIQWGRVYAFETSSGPIVKKLMPSEKDGCIKCVSFNSEEFPPYDLEISDIVDGTFCLVVGCVDVHTF